MSVYFKDGDATVAEVGGGGVSIALGRGKKEKTPQKTKRKQNIGGQGASSAQAWNGVVNVCV